MRLPLSMLDKLLLLKDYIKKVDVEDYRDMVVLYIECKDAWACREIAEMAKYVSKYVGD